MNNVPRTKHFSKEGDAKFSCSCCSNGGLSIPLLIVLEHIRMHFDKPVILLSGARCVAHNRAEGGAKRSEHIVTPEEPLSDATDFYVKDVSIHKVYMYLKELPYANLLGIGKYNNRIHVDTRGYAARWTG